MPRPPLPNTAGPRGAPLGSASGVRRAPQGALEERQAQQAGLLRHRGAPAPLGPRASRWRGARRRALSPPWPRQAEELNFGSGRSRAPSRKPRRCGPPPSHPSPVRFAVTSRAGQRSFTRSCWRSFRAAPRWLSLLPALLRRGAQRRGPGGVTQGKGCPPRDGSRRGPRARALFPRQCEVALSLWTRELGSRYIGFGVDPSCIVGKFLSWSAPLMQSGPHPNHALIYVKALLSRSRQTPHPSDALRSLRQQRRRGPGGVGFFLSPAALPTSRTAAPSASS